MLNKKFTIEDEKKIQDLWEENKVFEFHEDGRKVFSVDTPLQLSVGNYTSDTSFLSLKLR